MTIDMSPNPEERERVTVIIPAYNEQGRIGDVIKAIPAGAYKVLVVDDASQDGTVQEAILAGAEVIQKQLNTGYIQSIKLGLKKAETDLVVTMDADGEHDPADIPRLLKPLLDSKADLVLGVRPQIARLSERIINWLTNLKVRTQDCGTGMRALKRELASKLKLQGYCT